MSENKVLENDGVLETLEEVSYSNGSIIPKLAIAGAIIAVGIGAVVLYRRRKAKQLVIEEPVIVEEEKVTAKRSTKKPETVEE